MKSSPPRQVQLSDVSNPDWEELYNKLWKQESGTSYYGTHPRFRKYVRCQPEEVRLSQDGWNQIKKIIQDQGICVSVVNSCMGFSCSLVLWKDRQETFPGAVDEASPVFQVCTHMLPGDGHIGFKEGWAEFEPLFTCDENVARLAANRLDPPRPAHCYDY